jgi:hypothetical protein
VGLRAGAFFVVRARDNMLYRRYSHPVDKSTGLRSDQTIVLTGKHKDRNSLIRPAWFALWTASRMHDYATNFVRLFADRGKGRSD